MVSTNLITLSVGINKGIRLNNIISNISTKVGQPLVDGNSTVT